MRLALIDLNSAFVPIYEATKNDPVDNAHDICVEKIRRIADTADHVAVCIDSPPYDRTRLYAAYKAPRAPTADQLADRDARRVQLLRVQDTLRRDGFAVLGAPGQEADDVIAALVMQATTQPQITSITIWSSDKDLLQLVGPGVVVQSMRLTGETKAHPDPTGVDGVVARFGVGPERVAHVLALAGDGSDNVPGVPRVGERTAAKLVERHGTVEAVLAAAADGSDPEMKPALRAALVQHAEQARLSLQLVTLNHACAVELLDALKPRVQRDLDNNTRDEEEDMDAEFEPVNEQVNEPEAVPAVESRVAVEPARPARQEPAKVEAALVVHDPGSDGWAMALEPRTPAEAFKLARSLFESRLFSGLSNPDAALAAIMIGRERGLPALATVQNTHVIKGKITLSASLIVGLVLKSPLCEYFSCVETSNERAVYETKRRGAPTVQRLAYGIDDARQAGALGAGDSAWKKTPRTMLRHRCATELARMVYPDVVSGVYAPEELVDDAEQLPAGARAA